MEVSSTISRPAIGRRVFTQRGLNKHGPFDQPWLQVDVAPNTHGLITSTDDRRSFTTLFFVKWDSGETSGHYSRDFDRNLLFCIGNFQTFDDFKQAFTLNVPAKFTVEGHHHTRLREYRADLGTSGISAPIALEAGDEDLLACYHPDMWQAVCKLHHALTERKGWSANIDTYLKPRLAEARKIVGEKSQACCSWPKKVCNHKKAVSDIESLEKTILATEQRLASTVDLQNLEDILSWSDDGDHIADVDIAKLFTRIPDILRLPTHDR